MSKNELRRLAMLIYTANAWSSDQPGNGLALLSLGTTRKVHSEKHRQELIYEIRNCLNGLSNEYGDVPKLQNLLREVNKAVIGYEWLTDRQNLLTQEELYQEGRLNS